MAESKLDILLNFIKTGKGDKDAVRSIKGVDDAQGKAAKSSKTFSLAQLGVGVAATAAGVALLKQVPALVNLGIEYKRTETALTAYAGSAENAEAFTRAVSQAAGGSLSTFSSMQNATRLLSLGLAETAKEAGNLTKVGVTLGATMGKGPQAAMEEFNLLLANQSILRLDTFGISGAKVRERMAELAAEFPELDRNARFLNATLEIAGDRMAVLEAEGFQAVSSIDRMSAGAENAKNAVAVFLADGLVPYIDIMISIIDVIPKATIQLKGMALEFIRSRDATSLLSQGLAALEDITGSTAEELLGIEKGASSASVSLDKFAESEEEVALTAGGLNEILQEQEFLSKALGAALGGPISAATDRYQDQLKKVAVAEFNLAEGQKEINAQLKAGEITAEQAADKFNSLQKAYVESNQELNKLEGNLKKVTRELIFQQAAADLNAETALLLARELGLVDEATFAVAQEAQKLRILYDEGALSSQEFATEAGILARSVDALQSKKIEITAETLMAERAVDAFKRVVEGIPNRVVDVAAIVRVLGGGDARSAGSLDRGGFQEGGQFQVPDSGPLGDVNRVSFNAERGETITVTPRDGSAPAGTGGIEIGQVILQDEIGLQQFETVLERALGK